MTSAAAKDLSRQFSSMSEEKRRVVTGLANTYQDEEAVLGIFKTNAMVISGTEAAVFPWVCRANHACVPNCNYSHQASSPLSSEVKQMETSPQL